MGAVSTPQDYFILVIEPHTQVCEALRIILDYWGFRVLAVSTIEEAEHQMLSRNFTPDALIIDIPLSLTKGDVSFVLHISSFMERCELSIPVITITGSTDNHFRTIADELGWAYLLKPFSASAIFSALTSITEWHMH